MRKWLNSWPGLPMQCPLGSLSVHTYFLETGSLRFTRAPGERLLIWKRDSGLWVKDGIENSSGSQREGDCAAGVPGHQRLPQHLD